MALQEANSFAQGAKDEVEYLPVSVASLRQDTTIEFDLYLRTGPSEPAVLYTQKNSPFSKEAFKRLDENKISSLYVPAPQAGSRTTSDAERIAYAAMISAMGSGV